MTKNLEKIREEVRNLVEKLTENLLDGDYLDLLEEIEADINSMIECRNEELGK